jgi:hypothetical protein
MLLKKGESRYDLPELIEPKTARLYIYPQGDPKTNPGSHSYTVLMVNPYEMVRDGDPGPGIPKMFAVIRDFERSLLKFSPVPDQDYFATFCYFPKQKEI